MVQYIAAVDSVRLWIKTYGHRKNEACLFINGAASFEKGLAVDYTRELYDREEIHGAIGESHVKAQSSLTDRTELLKKVNVPGLILHGEEDYLVDKYGGIQTARSIPDSELLVIPRMGHMLFNTEIKNSVVDLIMHVLLSKKYHG